MPVNFHRQRATILAGNCSPDGQQTPYLPFIQVVRSSFGIAPGERAVDISRKIEAGLWEVRVDLAAGIARVLFTIFEGDAVLLHGFIKKSEKTPLPDMKTARQRKKLLK